MRDTKREVISRDARHTHTARNEMQQQQKKMGAASAAFKVRRELLVDFLSDCLCLSNDEVETAVCVLQTLQGCVRGK